MTYVLHAGMPYAVGQLHAGLIYITGATSSTVGYGVGGYGEQGYGE